LSEKESFGLVALEAMACGVPCIGTNVGGIPEVIEDGVTGFVCNLGDIEEFSAKAIRLLSDPDLYQQLSEHSVLAVKEKFAAQKIVEEYEAIYEQVLEQGSR
jgi:glycosyltransferase involved in cell wall biosynthesis